MAMVGRDVPLPLSLNQFLTFCQMKYTMAEKKKKKKMCVCVCVCVCAYIFHSRADSVVFLPGNYYPVLIPKIMYIG